MLVHPEPQEQLVFKEKQVNVVKVVTRVSPGSMENLVNEVPSDVKV